MTQSIKEIMQDVFKLAIHGAENEIEKQKLIQIADNLGLIPNENENQNSN